MNDIQVKCFLEIAYEKSFTKAANNLYITQPAISRYVAALEKELGVSLLDRKNKQVILTKAGEVYYDLFRRFQIEFENAKEKVNILDCKSKRNVKFAYITGWSVASFFPDILKKFSSRFPEILVSVECLEMKKILEALNTDKLDLVLVLDDCLEGMNNINKQKITEIQRLILYSKFHKLSESENLTPLDFKDETFYIIDNEEVHNKELEIRNFCKSYGFVPHLQLVPNMESVLALVENGLGVTFLDIWGQNINSPSFKYILIDSKHKVSVAWNKNNNNEIIHMLVNEIKTYLKQYKSP